ncbi:hypothetical protein CORC01_10971 [Colletotrichum orchidophilum]|uniref:Uncharacterized protein n=1 Tax=Colletotrichum orchidophilum TaxID=1209926 RepID=A0A1G4AX81_9PEZI|nr:uncharacterized protein CORC01_10971 [Colletotrichum orchidophilum]OHE93744.1 hypothetical protein CORC01_10971 [Colletotrichum orchidophilum]
MDFTPIYLINLIYVILFCASFHQWLKPLANWLITINFRPFLRGFLERFTGDVVSNMFDHESSLNWGDEFSFLIFDYSLVSDDETLIQLLMACILIRSQPIEIGDDEQEADSSHWTYYPWRVMEAIKPRFDVEDEEGCSTDLNSENAPTNPVPLPGVGHHFAQGKWLTHPPPEADLPSPRDDQMLAYLRDEFDQGNKITGEPFNVRYELGMFHRDLIQQLTAYHYRRRRGAGPITRQDVAARADTMWASNPSLRRFQERHQTVPWGVPVPFLTFQLIKYLPAAIEPDPELQRSWVSKYQIVCNPVTRTAYVRIRPGGDEAIGMTVEAAEQMIGGMRLLHVEMLKIWGLCRRRPMFWSGEDLDAFVRDIFEGAASRRKRIHLDPILSAKEHWRYIREVEGV